MAAGCRCGGRRLGRCDGGRFRLQVQRSGPALLEPGSFHEPGFQAIDAFRVPDWARSLCPACGVCSGAGRTDELGATWRRDRALCATWGGPRPPWPWRTRSPAGGDHSSFVPCVFLRFFCGFGIYVGLRAGGADFGPDANVDAILGRAVSYELWQLVAGAAGEAWWGGGAGHGGEGSRGLCVLLVPVAILALPTAPPRLGPAAPPSLRPRLPPRQAPRVAGPVCAGETRHLRLRLQPPGARRPTCLRSPSARGRSHVVTRPMRGTAIACVRPCWLSGAAGRRRGGKKTSNILSDAIKERKARKELQTAAIEKANNTAKKLEEIGKTAKEIISEGRTLRSRKNK